MLRCRATALLLVGASVAGCASAGDPPLATSSTTAGPVTTSTAAPTTTTAPLPDPVPVVWRDCGGGFDCATVVVPVDYLDATAGTLELALVRRPAGDPARRIGTLVVNPGGPGASGVRRVRRGFTVSPEVAARFDIVGFDPRGVGGSTPIRCGDSVSAFRATDLEPDDPGELDRLRAAARAVADECARTEGRRLAHLGSWEVVRDLEVIRRALGEETLSFVGLSYGTLLGLLWAEAYPGSVRALVLDGVVDPGAVHGATSEDQVVAVERTMAAIDAACAADPACPLAASGGVLAGYDELARRVEAGAAGGSGVGPTQLAYAALSATYGQDRWTELWRAIATGLGGDLRGVVEMARWFEGLVAYVPFALVTCLDAPHPTDPEAWQRAAERAARTSPRFGATMANELLPCAWWPASAHHRPHRVTAPGTPTVLVVGSTGDVATPFAQAERVADDLEAGHLLSVDLEGHIALGDSACADAAITRYLVDLVVPPVGARC